MLEAKSQLPSAKTQSAPFIWWQIFFDWKFALFTAEKALPSIYLQNPFVG